MVIVSSEIVADDAQADRRRYIREHHTDDSGEVHTAYYLGPANTDANAVMLARVPEIEAQRAEAVVAQKFAEDKDSAETKERVYLDGLSEAEYKQLTSVTDDELKAIRE